MKRHERQSAGADNTCLPHGAGQKMARELSAKLKAMRLGVSRQQYKDANRPGGRPG